MYEVYKVSPEQWGKTYNTEDVNNVAQDVRLDRLKNGCYIVIRHTKPITAIIIDEPEPSERFLMGYGGFCPKSSGNSGSYWAREIFKMYERGELELVYPKVVAKSGPFPILSQVLKERKAGIV